MGHGVIVEAERSPTSLRRFPEAEAAAVGGKRRLSAGSPHRGARIQVAQSHKRCLYVGNLRPRHGGGTETARTGGISTGTISGCQHRRRGTTGGLSVRSGGSTTSRFRLPRSGDAWVQWPGSSACPGRATSTCGGSSSANANARQSYGRSGTRPSSVSSHGWRPIPSISHFVAVRCSPATAGARAGRSRKRPQGRLRPCGSEPRASSAVGARWVRSAGRETAAAVEGDL